MSSYKFVCPTTSIEWLNQLGVAALYMLVLYVGKFFFESEGLVGHFEPASGLALAMLLIGGKRYAWGVMAGAFLLHAILGGSLWEVISEVSGDTIQALCGAWLLTHKNGFDWRSQSLRDFFRLILLGGCASVAVGALLVNLVLLVSGSLIPENYSQYLLHWWLSDTLGIVLITPLVLAWWRTEGNWRNSKEIAEAILLLGLTMLLGQIVFLGFLHDIVGQKTESYWMFMLISWVAMLLGARGTTFALLVVAIQALSGAMQGIGYFADDIATSHLMNFWFYILILSMVGMSLATYFNEIKQANFAVAHRDALIGEIHHRIKNNLQGITGLLRQLADNHPEITESINQTISQVQSVAEIHGLKERVPMNIVRLCDLTKAVATGVGSLWQRPIAVGIPSDWAPCIIDEAEAVPLALIMNELLSNAIKHGEQLGQVKITLEKGASPDSIRLIISNLGQLPVDFERNAGTGLQLVKSLMPRAGAKLSWQHQHGTVITQLDIESPVITLEPQT